MRYRDRSGGSCSSLFIELEKTGRDYPPSNVKSDRLLVTALSVQKLQQALHAKAKEDPSFRFYSLYDKVYREDVLLHAYRYCRIKAGAPGVDGITFACIEANGLEHWLGELTQEIRNRTYRPQAIRRVYIPKPNGEQRPLGIPTIRDRVAQTAMVMVLGPIFDPDRPSHVRARTNRVSEG